MPTKKVLIKRFREFCEREYNDTDGKMPNLVANDQYPEHFVIGCIDSRTSPAKAFFHEVGEAFCKRHATALVYPYRPDRENDPESTEFNVNFAVNVKGVIHLTIIFHRHCGGVKGLMASAANPSVNEWVDRAKKVLSKRGNANPDNDTLAQEVERQGLIWSLHNLAHYPSVKKAMGEGKLQIEGWYFDIEDGALYEYDPGTDGFVELFNVKKEKAGTGTGAGNVQVNKP